MLAGILGRMYEYKVDPVRYAWERCNPGVTFPEVLGGAGRGAFAVGLPNPWGSLTPAQKAKRAAPVREAVPRRIVGRRAGRSALAA